MGLLGAGHKETRSILPWMTQESNWNQTCNQLGTLGGRRVFWEWPNFLNNVQHIFPGGEKNCLGGTKLRVWLELFYNNTLYSFIYTCIFHNKFKVFIWASVSSNQVQCEVTFPSLRPYWEKMCTCFFKDAESLTTYGCALGCSQILILWTLQPHFNLWLSAWAFWCLFVWGHVMLLHIHT